MSSQKEALISKLESLTQAELGEFIIRAGQLLNSQAFGNLEEVLED